MIDVNTIKLEKGDTLLVSISSNELDSVLLNTLKKQFKTAFPKNKIAILGIGENDRVSVNVVKSTGKGVTNG